LESFYGAGGKSERVYQMKRCQILIVLLFCCCSVAV